MLPTKAVRLLLGEILAADTTLFPVAGNEVVLYQNNVTPNEDLLMADITVADFDGSTPLAAGAPPMQVGIDPLTGEQVLTVKEPAGSWRWETTGVTNLPQTIYGAVLTNTAGNVLFGILEFDEPITLQAAGEEINVPSMTFRFVAQPMS